MADVLKFERPAKQRDEELSHELRDFIDTVIVPTLVKEYLAQESESIVLAQLDSCVADSAAMHVDLQEVAI